MESINITEKTGFLIKAILIFLIILHSFIVVKCAWLGDDAYITFRVVDNFVNGYGLRWNIAERVQAYTHPLWMLLISGVYFFSDNIYYTGIFTSLIISILSVSFFAFAFPRSIYSAIFGMMVLTTSKAFIDYSTSGLENPLTHFFIVIFFYIFLRWDNSVKTIFYLTLVTSLAALNRLDTILIFLPSLTYSCLKLKQYRKSLKSLVIGFLPFIGWELFSLIYYGFLFPNTAYAKLNTGIPAFPLIKKSIFYFKDSLVFDPLTLTVILASLILTFMKKAWRFLPLCIGILLYLLYIISIGGCFMSGRFFTAPLLCSLIIITCLCFRKYSKSWIFILVIILIVGFVNPKSPIISCFRNDLNSNVFYKHNKSIQLDNGKLKNKMTPLCAEKFYPISDEQNFYYPEAGFLRVISGKTPDPSTSPAIKMKIKKFRSSVQKEKLVDKISKISVLRGSETSFDIGMFIGRLGFAGGPSVHFVDAFALTDPLLARLPVEDKVNFIIGHFKRRIPSGYFKTLRTGEDFIRNKKLSLFYKKLSIITRGRIFDPQRLIEIIKMNLGFYSELTKYYDKEIHERSGKHIIIEREEH